MDPDKDNGGDRPQNDQAASSAKNKFGKLAKSMQSSLGKSPFPGRPQLFQQSGQGEIEFLTRESRKVSNAPPSPAEERDSSASRQPSTVNIPGSPQPPAMNIPVSQQPRTINIPRSQQPPTMNIPGSQQPPTINIRRSQQPPTIDIRGSQQSGMKIPPLPRGHDRLSPNRPDEANPAVERSSQKTMEMGPANCQKTMDIPAEQYLGSGQELQKTVQMNSEEYRDSDPMAGCDGAPRTDSTSGNSEPSDFPRDGGGDSQAQYDPFQLVRTVLKDKYEIVAFIGRGGMGAVYLARHRILGKERAIKTMPKNSKVDPKLVRRFFNEARAAAAVEHPNVVQVHDIDETDRFYFIVMEYVKGKSLEGCLEEKGCLTPSEAVVAVREASAGLDAIHASGLIHRDVKPANLLLSESGRVKITDFGIVKEIGGDTGLTGDSIIGTPQYMAPEQITKGPIDCRTDIYSLGATFYSLLTGRSCFTGSAMQLIYQILQNEPIPPCELNPNVNFAVSRVVLTMMAKRSEERYRNMKEVQKALDQLGI